MREGRTPNLTLRSLFNKNTVQSHSKKRTLVQSGYPCSANEDDSYCRCFLSKAPMGSSYM